jgi:hypothetical protein
VPTRKALETLRSAEERMKTAKVKLRDFIERPDRQYSPEERAENKRLLDYPPASHGGILGSV